ncbi:S-adenosyl-L-methionine-dependent methyltransferase [Rhizophagus irregularis DAOM 181602=DAOM 197198]|nr:S-adenosyl-L-methionine-dependent methyltransferase [Rhizophagus irregularis DAOM 181602=DAOM 197198]
MDEFYESTSMYNLLILFVTSFFKRCGPGTWLLELSNTYTSSQFIGLDMKPIYPQEVNTK